MTLTLLNKNLLVIVKFTNILSNDDYQSLPLHPCKGELNMMLQKLYRYIQCNTFHIFSY